MLDSLANLILAVAIEFIPHLPYPIEPQREVEKLSAYAVAHPHPPKVAEEFEGKESK